MSMYKQFSTDTNLEKAGIDLDYGDFKVKIARRYIGTYEELTGMPFTAEVGDARKRIEKALKKAKLLS